MRHPDWRTPLIERQRWMLYLLPYVVYMLAGSFEPSPEQPGGKAIGLAIPYSYYPWLYTAKIALTVAAIAAVWPGYRQFPRRVTLLAIVVGVAGGPLWIALCQVDHQYVVPLLKRAGLGWISGAGERPGFNPFDRANGLRLEWAISFMAVRFFGLVAVVPLIEEFFLRGFVMRFTMARDWWAVPFGRADRFAVILGTAVPMLMHPGELLAAAVWFSLVTWLMLKTRTIWDCVTAHALTNLILGVYVVWHGGEAWRLL